MSETKIERQYRIFELLLEMWDSQALIELFDAEYQRGRDDYRDELLASLDKREIPPTQSQPVSAPVQSSSPARRTAPSPRADGANPPRPPGIPTTFAMIREMLQDHPAGLTTTQVADRIAAKYWPGLQGKFIGPDVSTSITRGKLKRDDDGRLTLTAAGLEVQSIDNRIVNKATQPQPRPLPAVAIGAAVKDAGQSGDGVLPKEPSRVPMPPVKPTGGERPPVPPLTEGMVVKGGRNDGESQVKERPAPPAPMAPRPAIVNGVEPRKEFAHDGMSVWLYPKEHAVVSRLKVNEGWVPFGLLVDAAFVRPERPPIDAAAWLRDIEPSINGKLFDVGLELKLVPKMGYALRKTDA